MSRDLTDEELAKLTPARQAAYLKKHKKKNKYKSGRELWKEKTAK